MVTILEPKVDISVEPVSLPDSLPEEVQPKAGYLEWRYAMPFAGVRYYSFQSRPAPGTESVKSPDTLPRRLSAQLIDERVILL